MLWLLVNAFEALCPFCLWLMAEGCLPEETVLFVFNPLIGLSGTPGPIADRQAFWIDMVFGLRVLVYAMLGRTL